MPENTGNAGPQQPGMLGSRGASRPPGLRSEAEGQRIPPQQLDVALVDRFRVRLSSRPRPLAVSECPLPSTAINLCVHMWQLSPEIKDPGLEKGKAWQGPGRTGWEGGPVVTHLLGTRVMVKQSGVSSRPTRQRQCGGRAGTIRRFMRRPRSRCSNVLLLEGGHRRAASRDGPSERVPGQVAPEDQAQSPTPAREGVLSSLAGVAGATARVCVFPGSPLGSWWRLSSESVSGWVVVAGPRESPVLPLARWVCGRRSGPAGSPCPAALPALPVPPLSVSVRLSALLTPTLPTLHTLFGPA